MQAMVEAPVADFVVVTDAPSTQAMIEGVVADFAVVTDAPSTQAMIESLDDSFVVLTSAQFGGELVDNPVIGFTTTSLGSDLARFSERVTTGFSVVPGVVPTTQDMVEGPTTTFTVLTSAPTTQAMIEDPETSFVLSISAPGEDYNPFFYPELLDVVPAPVLVGVSVGSQAVLYDVVEED